LKPFGEPDMLDAAAGSPLWRAIRDVGPLADPREAALWRISVTPSRGPEVTEVIARQMETRFLYDWGGGLVWLACPAIGDAGADVVHAAAAAAKGHATLMRAPE